jgi:hypothetical protein
VALVQIPVMPSHVENGVWGFLSGLLIGIATCSWFYFYFLSKLAQLERSKPIPSSFKDDVGLAVQETKAQQILVHGTTKEAGKTIGHGRTKSFESSILSNGEKGNDGDCVQVDDTAMKKSPSQSSNNAKPTQDKQDLNSTAVATNAKVYKHVLQRLDRDNKWQNVEDDSENAGFEFIILRREHPRFESPRFTTVIDVKDQIVKEILKECLQPEQAIFDEDDLVSLTTSFSD